MLERKRWTAVFSRTLYGEGGGGLKGIRSFWRGNGIAVFKMTPEMALRQGIFETFRELRGDFDEIVSSDAAKSCMSNEEQRCFDLDRLSCD